MLKKIIKKGNSSKIFININNQKIDFLIKDLNVYNILSSIAVLNELRLDICKIKSKLENIKLPEGRGRKHLISRYKKIQIN